jgi:chromosome segregation ATPase
MPSKKKLIARQELLIEDLKAKAEAAGRACQEILKVNKELEDCARADREDRTELLDAYTDLLGWDRTYVRVLGDYETTFFHLTDELTDLHASEADLRAQNEALRENLKGILNLPDSLYWDISRVTYI